MADSYLQASAHSALGAADIAAMRKEAKYFLQLSGRVSILSHASYSEKR